MGTIDSTSTEDQIVAAYLDNCTYREDDSAVQAAAFVSACMGMISRGIRQIEHQGNRLEFDLASLQWAVNDAREFIVTNTTGSAGGVGVAIHPDFSDFRG